jgi:short-subunit dehydrogenase
MKTVLITGATSGIGKEFTNIYAKRNYNLVLVSRDIVKLENIKN